MENYEILNDIDTNSFKNLSNLSFEPIYSSLFVGKENENIERFFESYGIDYSEVYNSKSKDINHCLINIRNTMKDVSEIMREFTIELFFKPHINDEDISNIEFLKSYNEMRERIIFQYDYVGKLLTEIYWILDRNKTEN